MLGKVMIEGGSEMMNDPGFGAGVEAGVYLII